MTHLRICLLTPRPHGMNQCQRANTAQAIASPPDLVPVLTSYQLYSSDEHSAAASIHPHKPAYD